MATPRGEQALRDDRRAFARLMWDTWSPPGWYRDSDFEAAAAAFDSLTGSTSSCIRTGIDGDSHRARRPMPTTMRG